MKLGLYLTGLLLLTSPLAADDQPLRDTMTVIGNGKTTVQATVASVQLAVEADGRTAGEVQQTLARKSKPVIDLLKTANVEKLESGALNIYAQYSQGTPSVVVGYRGSNVIKFDAPAKDAGELIDSSIKVGASSVQNVSVHPETSVIVNARGDALRIAIDNALRDANVVLTALKLKFIGITRIDVSPAAHSGPVRPVAYKMATERSANTTDILDQQQEIQASVTLEIRYDT